LSPPQVFDQDLVNLLIRFIEKERPALVKDWVDNFQKLDSKSYTSLPKDEVITGSDQFLDTLIGQLTEKEEGRIMTLLERNIKPVIQRRVAQGVNLESLLIGSLLHRDLLIKRLMADEVYKGLSEEKKRELLNITYRSFEAIHNGIAKMAHEAAISEIDRLRRFNENIITSVTEGIVIEDQNGIMTYTNPRFVSMLGYQKEELLGEHYEMLVPKEHLKMFREEASKRSLGMEGKYEASLRTKDDRTLPVLISARPLYEAGRYRGSLSVITDVTEMKRMQEELERSKKEAERLNAELEKHAKQLEEDNLRLRATLNIEPAKEAQDSGETVYELEPGYIYLLMSGETETSFRIFQDLVKHGHPGLCVTRILPDTIRKAYSLEKTPILWLTTNKLANQHCVSPTNIVDLSSAIINFMERIKDGVVLLDGIEYLITQNNYRSILNLMQLLNDKIMLNKSRIIVPLDPEVIDPKELHQLMREVRVYEDKRSKDLRRLSGPHF
jgi:PAS domain S-box-containing protein